MKVFYGNDPKKEEPKYPYFGIFKNYNSEYVVLFSSGCTGIIVKSNDRDRPMYMHSEKFTEN